MNRLVFKMMAILTFFISTPNTLIPSLFRQNVLQTFLLLHSNLKSQGFVLQIQGFEYEHQLWIYYNV